MGLSVDVYNEAQNYMIDVFNGYKIPMDPYTCPFHPTNLEYIRDSQSLQLWKRGKPIGKTEKVECPLCRKTFKTSEYYEFHLKTSHPSQYRNTAKLKLGQQEQSPQDVKASEQTEM